MAWDDDGDKARQDALRLLDLCTQAVNNKDEPLLPPLRSHFFHRASMVSGRAPTVPVEDAQTPLDDPRWAFGKVFLERRQHCDACNSPVYELVQCGECGAEYLSALEVMEKDADWLQPRLYDQDEDEFQQELEPLEEDDTEDETPEAEALSHGLPRLLVSSTVARTIQVRSQADGRLDWNQQGVRIHLLVPDSNHFLYCPCCNTQDRRANLFRPVRLGAPFLLDCHPSLAAPPPTLQQQRLGSAF